MNRDIAIFFIRVFVGVAVIGSLSLSIIKKQIPNTRANKILVCQISEMHRLTANISSLRTADEIMRVAHDRAVSQIENLREVK